MQNSWLVLSCLGLTIVSALVPWINAEVILLSFVAQAPSPAAVIGFIVVATVGQMVGKCLLYWTSRRTLQHRFKSGRVAASFERLRTDLAGHPRRAVGMVLLSSSVGLPPFYLVTIAAGTLRVNFRLFVAAGGVGRLVRFAAIGLAARLAL
ncbi:MAG: VTT domain-containing protein [Vicinamibacterales bacterium]